MEIRQMQAEDCKQMIQIDASHYIKKAWRTVEGKLKLIDIDYLDNTWPNGYETHYQNALLSVKNGFVLGAYEHENLVGFLCITPMKKWHSYDYVLLDQLFISKQYRGKGIGTKLFNEACEKLKLWSIDRVFICAGSAEETITFYKSLGCVEVIEKHSALYEEDPRDIQLEYIIKAS